MVNAKTNPVVFQNGTYVSDKPNKKLHGYGLANIKDIAEKYNGTLDVTFTDTEFSVIMIIRIH